jgi:AcrR family transcriptional regulator
VDVNTLPYRQRQARLTRETIAAAARGLFGERGYSATTIEAISAAAGIPVQTIYSAFGAKRAILEEVRTAWIAKANVANLYQEAMRQQGLGARLDAVSHWTRRQFELGHDVITTYQEAARVDPPAAEVWRAVLAGREAALRELIASKAADLRPGLTPERAVDTLIALTLAEAYGALVLERGWAADEYERWLARSLRQELVAPAA